QPTSSVSDRNPMFSIQLTPLQQTAAALPDWSVLPETGNIRLSYIASGKYHLRILDWQGSVSVMDRVYESEIEIGPGSRTITIPLGAGSVAGQIKWTDENHFLTVVYALRETGLICRRAYCDNSGNFCLRYLPSGKYVLKAHDHKAGWSDLGSVNVKQ